LNKEPEFVHFLLNHGHEHNQWTSVSSTDNNRGSIPMFVHSIVVSEGIS
jgi:hypothetical protein